METETAAQSTDRRTWSWNAPLPRSALRQVALLTDAALHFLPAMNAKKANHLAYSLRVAPHPDAMVGHSRRIPLADIEAVHASSESGTIDFQLRAGKKERVRVGTVEGRLVVADMFDALAERIPHREITTSRTSAFVTLWHETIVTVALLALLWVHTSIDVPQWWEDVGSLPITLGIFGTMIIVMAEGLVRMRRRPMTSSFHRMKTRALFT